MPRKPSLPTYRRRVIRGRATGYLTLPDRFTGRRKDYLLGPYGSPESHQRYARLIAEWTVRQGRIPDDVPDLPGDVMLVDQLIDRWWEAEGQWLGFSTQHMIRSALEVLSSAYGQTPAIDFGPLALRAVRDRLVAGDPKAKPRARKPWSRKTVNEHVEKLRSVFRWAVGQQLLPVFVYDALKAVEHLKAGRSAARESKTVLPVDPKHVDAVQPFVSNQVWTMVTLQRLTGMRSSEICKLCPADLNMSDDAVWVYRLTHHKTAHRGRKRTVYLGPQAIEALRPYVTDRRIDAPCFSPAEAEAARREARHQARVTPLSCGNRPGTNRKISPKVQPGHIYKVAEYRRAIQRACDLAGVPHWHPHQLRHTYATQVRRQFGLEAAQIMLGHSSAIVTDAVYAERDERASRRIAEKIG